jgi:hypothetical protein
MVGKKELSSAQLTQWFVLAPFVVVPSDGVFGRFDLAALRSCHTLFACLFICLVPLAVQSAPEALNLR